MDYLSKFDLFDESLITRESWDKFKEMRDARVVRSEMHGGYWILSRYADTVDAFRDWKRLSSARGVAIPNMWEQNPSIPIECDPPEHPEYRSMLTAAFSPGSVRHWEGEIRSICDNLIDGFESRGEVDLGLEYAMPMPMTVLCRMLGVPESDGSRFCEWVHGALHSGGDMDAAFTSAGRIHTYFGELVDAARGGAQQMPEGSLIRILLDGQAGSRTLSRAEVMDYCLLLVVAGVDTVTAMLGNFFAFAIDNPSLQEQLIANPDKTPRAVEEGLRLFGPVQAMARKVNTRYVVEGCHFDHDAAVMLLMPAANRDEREFPDADTFLLDRAPNRHLAFGAGIHRCLGSTLARTQLRIAINQLLGRVGQLRAGPGSRQRRIGNVRYYHSVPAAFGPPR